MNWFKKLGIALAACFALAGVAAAQKWQNLKHPPTFQTDTALQLTDGTVMVHEYLTPNWWRLTPNNKGSYLNGTWSKLASLPSNYGPLYFASAVMADRIAREADFLSVGTNDLTQYTLAMDRGHPELAARLDALHPAVLRLIAKTVEAARVYGRTVAVCGGLASDPVAVPVLIGLGVHELSMVPAVIPQLKALIATLNVDDCTALATHALERETAEAVRALTLRTVSGLDATGRARE